MAGKLFIKARQGLYWVADGTSMSSATKRIDADTGAIIPGSGSIGSTALAETTVQYAEVSLTNAEMLALRATPKTLVAAPGAGKFIEFISAQLLFDYVGAYTETADNMQIKYTDGSGASVSETIEATGFVDATADSIIGVKAGTSQVTAATNAVNKALVLHNTGDGEYGGGNAGNAVRVKVSYRVHTTGF